MPEHGKKYRQLAEKVDRAKLYDPVEAVSLVAWFAAIATARTPRGMRDLMAYCLRYQAQTYAYLALLTSRYPSLASGSGFQFEEASDVPSGRP